MARKIWINPDRVDIASKSIKLNGVKFSVSISAFDTPKELVGTYDKGSGSFTISFKYEDVEPSVKSAVTDDVEFFEGKYSGKLLKIVVPVDKHNVAAVSVQTKILDALKERRRSFGDDSRYSKTLNQSVAETVLTRDFGYFEPELVAQ